MWQKQMWVLWIILLGLVACGAEPTQVEYVGSVLDAQTLEPVQGAEVTFSFAGAPPVVYTDLRGVYRFLLAMDGNPLPGQIVVRADGYETYFLNVTLRANTLSLGDVRLTRLQRNGVAVQPTASAETVAEERDTVTPITQPTNPPTNTPEPTNTPTATAIPKPEAGDPWVRPADNMTLRFVPGGTFPMGSEDGQDDEEPVA
jgi:hypothetical protein